MKEDAAEMTKLKATDDLGELGAHFGTQIIHSRYAYYLLKRMGFKDFFPMQYI
jgi:hypothetical protein